ncbi:type II CAAX prenyl endopeptidase Rce1 family protein [Dyadobacter sp. 3J3]|uniref:CPBP family glutamic-type intramembrane protease n=1 Tax=Dyadobacter sp. 3J3 TaxID=2606600 RepID=UPI0038D4D420
MSFLCVVSSYIIFKCIHTELPKNLTQEYLRRRGFLYAMVIVNIIAPIFEEIGFRLCLKYTPFNFSIMAGYFGMAIVKIYFSINWFDIGKSQFVFLASIFLLFSIFTYNMLSLIFSLNIFFSFVWREYYNVVFISSATLFGFCHILNFDIKSDLHLYFLVLLLVFPQIICGVWFGYVRLKHGIEYAILLHSLYNLIPNLIYFITYYIV